MMPSARTSVYTGERSMTSKNHPNIGQLWTRYSTSHPKASRHETFCALAAAAWLAFAPVAYGQCPSSFASAVNYSVGGSPRCVAIGDLNGDGRPDLVAASESGATVSVL